MDSYCEINYVPVSGRSYMQDGENGELFFQVLNKPLTDLEKQNIRGEVMFFSDSFIVSKEPRTTTNNQGRETIEYDVRFTWRDTAENVLIREGEVEEPIGVMCDNGLYNYQPTVAIIFENRGPVVYQVNNSGEPVQLMNATDVMIQQNRPEGAVLLKIQYEVVVNQDDQELLLVQSTYRTNGEYSLTTSSAVYFFDPNGDEVFIQGYLSPEQLSAASEG